MPNSIMYVSKVLFTLGKYIYYGLKQRFVSLFKREMGIFEFLKSLIRIPVEAYVFASIELRAYEECPNVC